MKVFRGLNHFKSSLKFENVSELDIKKEILNLSSKRAAREGDILAKTLKNSINAYLSELTLLINNCISKGVFPDDPKLAEIRLKYMEYDCHLFSKYLVFRSNVFQKCWIL